MPNSASSKKDISFLTLISGLPFLMFYWIAPFISTRTVGNDYLHFPIENQLYLMFSLKLASFPLYIPGFYIGQSSAALTLGQIYHPLPHLASFFPGYWQGLALEWMTFLRLLSLGLTQSLLFLFLRRLQLRALLSFLISFITLYNLRLVEMFRYGASLEATTAHLMLIAVIGLWWLNPHRRSVKPLLIIFLTYLLVVSGHPQMMLYGLLGSGVFVLLVPYFCAVILPDRTTNWRQAAGFWIKAGGLIAAGVLLASAYTIPFYFDFVLTNSERAGRGFAWANTYLDTWAGAWGNFFNPFLSSTASAFGASPLIGLALVLPVLKLCRMSIPKIIWVIWALTVMVFLCMMGGKTPLYMLFWKSVPFAASVRIPGRISFILPMLLMLLLAWITTLPQKNIEKANRPPVKILAFTALLVTFLYNGLIYPWFGLDLQGIDRIFAPTSLMKFNLNDPFLSQSNTVLIFLASTWLGIFILFLVTKSGLPPKSSTRVLALICLLTVCHVLIFLRHGTYYRVKKKTLTFEQLLKQNRAQLAYPFYPGGGLSSQAVKFHLERSFSEPFLAKTYQHIIPVNSRAEVYERMNSELTPQTAFMEGVDQTWVQPYLQGEGGRIQLRYSSYNRLLFDVNTPHPAVFGLAFPYSPHWHAWISGQKAKTYRINGLYSGVSLPGGHSEVEFRYFSQAAYLGMALSCIVLFLTGGLFCGLAFAGWPRVIGLISITLISAGLFHSWQSSLYTGKNIGTIYDWLSMASSEKTNIAYGKKVTVNTSFPEFPPMRMVDGDARVNSGFISKHSQKPQLVMDLDQSTRFAQLKFYEAGNRPPRVPNVSLFGQFFDKNAKDINVRPLVIETSEDRHHWQTVAAIDQPKQSGQPVVITLKEPQNARYIRLTTPTGILGFDEIEVYQ